MGGKQQMQVAFEYAGPIRCPICQFGEEQKQK